MDVAEPYQTKQLQNSHITELHKLKTKNVMLVICKLLEDEAEVEDKEKQEPNLLTEIILKPCLMFTEASLNFLLPKRGVVMRHV